MEASGQKASGEEMSIIKAETAYPTLRRMAPPKCSPKRCGRSGIFHMQCGLLSGEYQMCMRRQIEEEISQGARDGVVLFLSPGVYPITSPIGVICHGS